MYRYECFGVKPYCTAYFNWASWIVHAKVSATSPLGLYVQCVCVYTCMQNLCATPLHSCDLQIYYSILTCAHVTYTCGSCLAHPLLHPPPSSFSSSPSFTPSLSPGPPSIYFFCQYSTLPYLYPSHLFILH